MVKWWSIMIVTLKKDGLPSRNNNYKKLNDAIPRQISIIKSPSFCASPCPPGNKKMLLDAKDGNHSVVLA